MEQIFNLKFVSEVEKHPVLYNYKIKGYCRKDVTDKAWSDVGKEVNLTVNECKEKWKNLRSVYVRHMKPSPSGAGTKSKKPYYLAEAMQFTLPFIKTLGIPTGNLPSNPHETTVADPEQGSAVPTENIYNQADEEEGSESLEVGPPSPFSQTIPTPSTQLSTPFTQRVEAELSQEMPSNTPTSRSRITNRKVQKRAATDVDKSFSEYLQAKTKKINNSNTLNEEGKQKYDNDKRMFLLSLLPEIEPMTDTQMKSFRRKVLQLIDDIINSGQYVPTYQFTPTGSHSSMSIQSGLDVTSEGLSSEHQLTEHHDVAPQEYYNVVREVFEQ